MGEETSRVGLWGEQVAAAYLMHAGYTILDRNYHTRVGEIDIIAISPAPRLSCLVFVEVKTRTSQDHGYPEDAVSKKKWHHLQAAIQCYLEAHQPLQNDWCVDVIAIIGQPTQESPQIQHFENIVMADDRY